MVKENIMLEAFLGNMDGVEDNVKALYKEVDGGFQLDVNPYVNSDTGVNLGLVDTAGLKSALEKERGSNKDLGSQLKGLQAISELGLTADAIKDLQSSVATNGKDVDTKIQAVHDQYKVKMDEMSKTSADALEKMTAANHNREVTSILAANAGKLVDGAGPQGYIANIMKGMSKVDENGRIVAVNADGTPMISQKPGSADAMGLSELFEVVSSNPVHSFAFSASGATGSGSTGSSGGGGTITTPTDGASWNSMTNEQRSAFFVKDPTAATSFAQQGAKLIGQK